MARAAPLILYVIVPDGRALDWHSEMVVVPVPSERTIRRALRRLMRRCRATGLCVEVLDPRGDCVLVRALPGRADEAVARIWRTHTGSA